MENNVSTSGIGGHRDAAGIAYLVIPDDRDRNQYIQRCFRTGTISIAFENGGVMNDVPVTRQALNDIEFPSSNDELGSQLVWVNQKEKQVPIIIGCISKNNEFVNFTKDSASLRKSSDGGVFEVMVDANKNIVIINSSSQKDTGGDIYVIASNTTKTAKLNVSVFGNINVNATNVIVSSTGKTSFIVKDKDVDDKITEVSYEKGIGFVYKDEFGNEAFMNNDNIQFKPIAKFKVGDGAEHAMLGDTFKTILEDLVDSLSQLASSCAQLTVSTPMGPSTIPINTDQFLQIASDLNEIKTQFPNFQSQVNFTD